MATAIREVNQTNLRRYIKEAISLGYKKQQFIPRLLKKGWTTQEINNVMQ